MRVFAYRPNSLLNLIGNTPLIKLENISKISGNNIFAKLELMNPSGSIKDRIVLEILNSAENKRIVEKNSIIVEASTGNTGISLAMISSIKNYKAVIFVPKNISREKIKMMKAYGAKIVEINDEMKKVVEAAKRFSEKKKAFFLNQFEREENVIANIKTGKEIFDQMKGEINAFVAGVGTGGTLIGIAKFLKERIPEIKIIAVEPEEMPALYSKFYGKKKEFKKYHLIEGIGEGFVPKIVEKNMNLIDDVILVKSKEALKTTRMIIKKEGFFVGISSGANVFASIKFSKKIGRNKNIVTVFPDGSERYLSTKLF